MGNIEKNISLSIKTILSRLENDTTKYLNSFELQAQILLSNDEEMRKKLLRNYKRFSIIIKAHMDELNSVIARLSSYICKADDECDKKLTEQLLKLFNHYEIFQGAVIKFMSNCDSAFLDDEDSTHQAQIITYSRELWVAIKNYNQNI